MAISQKEQKNVRALKTSKGRRTQGRFAAEGIRVLEEALKWHCFPQVVYYSGHLLGDRGRRLIEEFSRAGVDCRPATARQISQMADSVSPQGIVAVFSYPEPGLDESFVRSNRRILLCDNISDPGNLGTLLRSALAFGFKRIILSGNTTDSFAPKVIRSSAGAVFGLAIARAGYAEIKGVIGKMKDPILAAVPGAPEMTVPPDKGVILAIGSEADGLGDDVIAMASGSVGIRHSGEVESLNAAVAGSILMSEIYLRS